jgi:5-methylcytosine-specific restriction endonuclease McrA
MRFPRIRDVRNDTINGTTVCRNCTNPVPPRRKHYCSDSCLTEFNRNNSWYWVRKDVLRRDRFRCSICGERKRKALLDVDHIIPLQMGGKHFDKGNLRTLCKECHKAKTKLDSDAQKSI